MTTHPVARTSGIDFCPVCHLVAPCYDGQILEVARNHRQFTVDEIRAQIETAAALAEQSRRRGRRRRFLPLKRVCRKNLHPFTPANTVYERSNGVTIRRCLTCRTLQRQERERRKGRKPHPSETGVCRKGLHAWVEDNWMIDKSGAVRCKPCRKKMQKEVYQRNQVVHCIVKGCPRATHRGGGNYVCKYHREHPPSWFAKLGKKIKGTQLV